MSPLEILRYLLPISSLALLQPLKLPVSESRTSPNILQADSARYKYALTLMQDMMKQSIFVFCCSLCLWVVLQRSTNMSLSNICFISPFYFLFLANQTASFLNLNILDIKYSVLHKYICISMCVVILATSIYCRVCPSSPCKSILGNFWSEFRSK